MPAHAFANAIVGGFPDRNGQPQRELVVTVPLPEDRGRKGDARPKTHRFRSHWLELGQRLRAFRERYGLTQDEVARAVEASEGTTVGQWENGVNVPDGIRWYRRASRERRPRETIGPAVAAVLDELRVVV